MNYYDLAFWCLLISATLYALSIWQADTPKYRYDKAQLPPSILLYRLKARALIDGFLIATVLWCIVLMFALTPKVTIDFIGDSISATIYKA